MNVDSETRGDYHGRGPTPRKVDKLVNGQTVQLFFQPELYGILADNCFHPWDQISLREEEQVETSNCQRMYY